MDFLRQSVHALCQAVKKLLRAGSFEPINDTLVLNTVLYPVVGAENLIRLRIVVDRLDL